MHINSKFLHKYGILLGFSAIFWGLYFGALFQGWSSFTLLSIPLFQYLLYVWVYLAGSIKSAYIFHSYQMYFSNLGNSRKISQFFYFFSLAELVIIILMGIESIRHPQLVTTYFVLYLIPFALIYILSPFFSMNSLFSEANITIVDGNQEKTTIQLQSINRKRIFISSVLVTMSLSILWIIFSILAHFGIMNYVIPVPSSTEKLNISAFFIIIVIISFIHPIALFGYVHISILKATILNVKKRKENDRKILLGMIKNYILVPRFFKAWL